MRAYYYNTLLDLAVWLTNRASAFYVWAWQHAQRYDGAAHYE